MDLFVCENVGSVLRGVEEFKLFRMDVVLANVLLLRRTFLGRIGTGFWIGLWSYFSLV